MEQVLKSIPVDKTTKAGIRITVLSHVDNIKA